MTSTSPPDQVIFGGKNNLVVVPSRSSSSPPLPPSLLNPEMPAVAAYSGAEDPRLRWLDMSKSERAALSKEAKNLGVGSLYCAFGGGEEGLMACAAIDALCEVGLIDKLLGTFIKPLQGDDISTPRDQRVHCSLNLNTETGRLSSRKPNLQNQPALEKDRYKVRAAFTADVERGRSLIVADYGQLELRILAAMTDCASMKEAFRKGGDFHSRTAYGMYQHIKDAVAAGKCRLEEGEGDADIPLIKDMFGAERRLAKILNFSLAYGKTVHGLANDFGQTQEEAQATLDAWYSDRPEVKRWQIEQRINAHELGYVTTILGRRRNLPDAKAAKFQQDSKYASRTVGKLRPMLKMDAQKLVKELRRKAAACSNREEKHKLEEDAAFVERDPLNWLQDRGNSGGGNSGKTLSGNFRAAINTPIQGSAADVVTAAMIEIQRNKELKKLGWTLLLQVHDEVILEGPKESATRAKEIVDSCMEKPFAGNNPFDVKWEVDSNIGTTWYEAK